MSNVHIRFDDIDHYEPSDSENEEERLLLDKNYRKTKEQQSDSEEEVFGLDREESDDDDEDVADSDVEGQEDDELPNIRAWGKSKRDFYSTDYVDQDYGGYEGKDAQSADLEEAEAKAIQIRLTEQLNDEDFMLNLFDQTPETSTAATTEETIKKDLANLSKRELQQLLQKESPELLFLIDDCKSKLLEIKYVFPVLKKINSALFVDSQFADFVTTFYELLVNYVANIYMYLLIKASRENPQKHPVLKRLYQYKKLIAELEPIYVEIIKPQIEIISNMNHKIAQIKTNKTSKTAKKPEEETSKPDEETENLVENDDETMEVDLENTKRAITYQIAKNKGLTPHRKKETRNPRVKHRNKFRKANIRRKGAVREVRTEVTRYGGEISGIKASVSKSVKFK